MRLRAQGLFFWRRLCDLRNRKRLHQREVVDFRRMLGTRRDESALTYYIALRQPGDVPFPSACTGLVTVSAQRLESVADYKEQPRQPGKQSLLNSPCLNPDFRRDADLVGRRPRQGRYNAPRRAVDELGTPENHPRCACWRRSYFRHGLLGAYRVGCAIAQKPGGLYRLRPGRE